MEETREYRFDNGNAAPLYLTNQGCEVTENYADLLDRFSLPYGEFEGDFYPLTKAEEIYIADDMQDEIGNGIGALMGYSALYKGQKFLAPSVEVQWGEVYGASSDAEALEFAKRFVAEIEPRVSAIGGHVLLEEDMGPDRHCVQILIPFTHAQATAQDYDGWASYLTNDLLKTSGTLDDVKTTTPKV